MVSLPLLLALIVAQGPGTNEPPSTLPIEERPYRIRALVSFDISTRIDLKTRDRLLSRWVGDIRRWVGPAWDVDVASPDSPISCQPIDRVTSEAFLKIAMGFDKVWLIRGESNGTGVILRGREYDVTTGIVGSLHERKVSAAPDMARDLFALSESLFAPVAELGDPVGDGVPLRVQGVHLASDSGLDRIAPLGTIFGPIRLTLDDANRVLEVQRIPHTYLQVDVREGGTVRGKLVRGVRDPLSKRYVRKNRLVGLGLKPAAYPTRLRFLQAGDRSPGAGFVLTARPIEKGLPREVATTDREGRVVLPPGFATELVVLRLVAGRSEPMVELPIMPGESSEELTITFTPRPQTLALESRLDSLRDSLIDLVAARNRLERRMKAREAGDDWIGVEEALGEYRKLPERSVYAERLQKLEDEAAQEEARTKSLILTRTARTQLAETRGLIDRYLDDDVFKAYEEAVARSKERDAQAKGKPKAATPTPPREPVPTVPPAQPRGGPTVPF